MKNRDKWRNQIFLVVMILYGMVFIFHIRLTNRTDTVTVTVTDRMTWVIPKIWKSDPKLNYIQPNPPALLAPPPHNISRISPVKHIVCVLTFGHLFCNLLQMLENLQFDICKSPIQYFAYYFKSYFDQAPIWTNIFVCFEIFKIKYMYINCWVVYIFYIWIFIFKSY